MLGLERLARPFLDDLGKPRVERLVGDEPLKLKEVISTGNQAAVWFENRTPQGVVESCDWVRVEYDQIQEIRSFYDSAPIREVLSPDEQESLDGPG